MSAYLVQLIFIQLPLSINMETSVSFTDITV